MTTAAVIGTLLGGVGGLISGGVEKAEQPAFLGGLIGAGIGLLVYLIALIGDLR